MERADHLLGRIIAATVGEDPTLLVHCPEAQMSVIVMRGAVESEQLLQSQRESGIPKKQWSVDGKYCHVIKLRFLGRLVFFFWAALGRLGI